MEQQILEKQPEQQRLNMVPIEVIATGICMSFGDTTRKHFDEHLVNLVNAYKEMHIWLPNTGVGVKTISLPADNMVELPCDFILETKVGVINQHGRIAVMSVDRNLRIPVPRIVTTDTQLQCALDDIFKQNIGSGDVPFYNFFDGSAFVGELYGYSLSINTLGYYNVDKRRNILMVSESCPWAAGNIILEYISDGVSAGLTLIPSELVNCLTLQMKAMYCLDKGDNRFAEFNRLYELSYKRAKRLALAKPIDFYAEIFKQHHQYAPK